MNTSFTFPTSYLDAGMAWNALLFVVHRLASFITYCFLFFAVSTQEFSWYINATSWMFLILLWSDFGLRKAIPWHLSHSAKSSSSKTRMLLFIVILQSGALVIISPLVWLVTASIPGPKSLDIFYLIPLINALFFVEGIAGLLRLISHSFFLYKKTSLVSATALCMELGALGLSYIAGYASYQLIVAIILSKVLVGCCAIYCTATMIWNFLRHSTDLVPQAPKSSNSDTKHYDLKQVDFFIHTGAMWATTVLKSLSERNFIIPLATYCLGSELGNILKIAQEGALFFQRLIVKTLATIDTSFLTYILAGNLLDNQNVGQYQDAMQQAFWHLIRRVGFLVGLVTILFIAIISTSFTTPFALTKGYTTGTPLLLFIILTFCYLIEALFIPCERLLEVTRSYRSLAYSYLPYVLGIMIILCMAFLGYWSWCGGLMGFVIAILGVRLVSMVCMAVEARMLIGRV